MRIFAAVDAGYQQWLAGADRPELQRELSQQRGWFWVGVMQGVIACLLIPVGVVSLIEEPSSVYGWIFGVAGPVWLYFCVRALVRNRQTIRFIRARLRAGPDNAHLPGMAG